MSNDGYYFNLSICIVVISAKKEHHIICHDTCSIGINSIFRLKPEPCSSMAA